MLGTITKAKILKSFFMITFALPGCRLSKKSSELESLPRNFGFSCSLEDITSYIPSKGAPSRMDEEEILDRERLIQLEAEQDIHNDHKGSINIDNSFVGSDDSTRKYLEDHFEYSELFEKMNNPGLWTRFKRTVGIDKAKRSITNGKNRYIVQTRKNGFLVIRDNSQKIRNGMQNSYNHAVFLVGGACKAYPLLWTMNSINILSKDKKRTNQLKDRVEHLRKDLLSGNSNISAMPIFKSDGRYFYRYFSRGDLRYLLSEVKAPSLGGTWGLVKFLFSPSKQKAFKQGTERYEDKFQQLDDRRYCSLAVDMWKALETLEYLRVVHNDIKPDNIFVETFNGDLYFFLGDFGVSRYVFDYGTESKPKNPGIVSRRHRLKGNQLLRAPELKTLDSGFRSTTASNVYSMAVLLNGYTLDETDNTLILDSFDLPNLSNELNTLRETFRTNVNQSYDQRQTAKSLLKATKEACSQFFAGEPRIPLPYWQEEIFEK